MKNTMQLNLSQKLTMTPQLQQSIRLLQVSSLDLQKEVIQAVEENPLLEIDDIHYPSLDSNSPEDSLTKLSAEADFFQATSSPENNELPQDKTSLNEELPYQEVFEPRNKPSDRFQNNLENYHDIALQTYQDSASLKAHLLWQLSLSRLTSQDKAIAHVVIDSIAPTGYLLTSPSLLMDSLQDFDITEEELSAVIKFIQNFEPFGCASLDLKSFLQLQLDTLSPQTPYLSETKKLLKQNSREILKQDFNLLSQSTKFKKSELVECFKLLRTLKSQPAVEIQTSAQYIKPDAYVFKQKGGWQIQLAEDSIPPLKLNQSYVAMVTRTQEERDYIQKHLQDARSLIQGLKYRSDTFFKVASWIVQFQYKFFEYGESAIKPMFLRDVARATSLHESTVSRVTTQRYLYTPLGIFELKYFFSSQLESKAGDAYSSRSIHAKIKQLIGAENKQKPLSDSKISNMLKEEGILVARRTVTKYRESLNILSSTERKKLF